MLARINDVAKKHVTIDFKHKRDLYRIVTNENVEFVFNVKFPAMFKYEIKIVKLCNGLFYDRYWQTSVLFTFASVYFHHLA